MRTTSFFLIGAKLLHFQHKWRELGVLNIVQEGVKPNWISKEAPKTLQTKSHFRQFKGTKLEMETYQKALQEEIDQGIVVEVGPNQIKYLNRTFIIPRKDKRLRKILDCRPINKQLKDIPFKAENINMVITLVEKGDWGVTIDIHNAYNHIMVHPSLQQYLGFAFQDRFYIYKGMPFGLKTAPAIFYRHLHPAIQYLRIRGIRLIVFYDDILIVCQDPIKLQDHTRIAIQILEEMGWTISKKSSLNPSQTIHYLGWIWNLKELTIQMPQDRRRSILHKVLKYSHLSRNHETVKIKRLAGIIGKLQYLKPQIQRAGLHLKVILKPFNKVVNQRGWHSLVRLTPKMNKNWTWWIAMIRNNQPTNFQILQPEVLLTTDASMRGWGATLLLHKNNQELMSAGKWKNKWRLTSSNQRELAAVFCALRRFANLFREEKIHSIHLRTDNTTTSFNINRKNSSNSLATLTDWTLRLAEQMQIQIKATYIPGIENQVADSLSRLNRAGDYQLNKTTYNSLIKQLKMKPTIDLFASKTNKLTRRYCTITQDQEATARDAFSIPWT
ncbi:MAG: putative reverse transcriptase [Streblomastix strix]|uniref:Putative reverse transcriptase n=1 Tax=Streblomastix strix TaxID=222440 RepID=A0A5J4WU38_9EUKA|nr:MAG: putative reverse transcriptase [Streblomastix strix]